LWPDFRVWVVNVNGAYSGLTVESTNQIDEAVVIDTPYFK
jgi:hypothetical protein